MKTQVLVDQIYHDEIENLLKDEILIKMFNEIPAGFDLNQITFGTINKEYYRRGGKHQALTIGSFKTAMQRMVKNEK